MARQRLTSGRRFAGLLAAAVLALAIPATATVRAATPSITPESLPAIKTLAEKDRKKLPNEDIAERLMSSTCHIRMFKGKISGRGTGWVLDVANRLIITNHHVVDIDGPVEKLQLYFPIKRDGEWVKDDKVYYYTVRPAIGTVLASSNVHDLALVQVDYLPKGVVALPLAKKSAPAGSQLHSIGGKPIGSDPMWIYTVGRVRQVGRGRLALGHYTRIIEAQMALNAGNSGGPIVNDYCELVGVCEGGRGPRNGRVVNDVSMLVDVKTVRKFLADVLPLVHPGTAEQFYRRGVKHANVKRYASAVRDFSAAIKLNPKSAKAFDKRGWAFLKQGDSRTAMGDFDQALQIDSTLADAYQGRGQCHQTQRKYAEAIRDYTNAIRFEPENALHYNMRGVASLRNKDTQASYQDFVQATKLDDKNVLYLSNRGFVARLLKLYKDAAETFARAIELQPTNFALHNELGQVLLDSGRNDAAAKSFVKAIVLYKERYKKDNWQFFRNWGVALYRDNKLDDAYKVLSKAIVLNGNNAELYYLRGLVAKKYGNQNLAAENFRKAAQLDPKKYGQNANAAGTSTPNNGNSGNGTAAANAGDGRLPGVWVVRYSVNGASLGIAIAFGADGSYASSIVTVDAAQKKTTKSFQGRYTVQNGKFNVRYSDGTTATYKYGFRDGKLWVYHPQLKTVLYFTRHKSGAAKQ